MFITQSKYKSTKVTPVTMHLDGSNFFAIQTKHLKLQTQINIDGKTLSGDFGDVLTQH